jgi:hypothetical protein
MRRQASWREACDTIARRKAHNAFPYRLDNPGALGAKDRLAGVGAERNQRIPEIDAGGTYPHL